MDATFRGAPKLFTHLLVIFAIINRKNMDEIFHEKQEGSLCAQHCLNVLLQGPFFTAVDLATLAQQMDEEERTRMSEAGVDSEEYRNFVSAGSQNMDDSGYFSVQVISSALRVWDLDLVRYTSSDPSATEARANLTRQTAFICNYRDHWFTIRRLGQQWFNLNSLLTGPELLSDTYLAEFLAQLIQEGYSIFIVLGALPDCSADRVLQTVTVSQAVKPRLISEQRTIEALAGDDQQLRDAIAASIDGTAGSQDGLQSEEAQLQAALAASLLDGRCATTRTVPEMDDEQQLQAAIALSLEGSDTVPPPTSAPTPADSSAVRVQREAFLDRLQQRQREQQHHHQYQQQQQQQHQQHHQHHHDGQQQQHQQQHQHQHQQQQQQWQRPPP